MAFQIFGQRDPRWSGHALGSQAGELGPYGCFVTCGCMVAYDAYPDMHYNPATFDDAVYGAGVFQNGDELPDNFLDRVWPDRFKTTVETGWNQAAVNAALADPYTYCIVCIHNPAIGVPGYHFMVVYSPSQVADPWYANVARDGFWGIPGDVVKVLFVKSLKPQRDAAIAAAAAQAAAKAKAAADAAAAAKAAADAAAAAAAAKAAADAAAAKAAQEAAAEQAAADAREQAAHAAADAAARASAAQMHAGTPITPSSPDFWAWLQNVILALAGKVRG